MICWTNNAIAAVAIAIGAVMVPVKSQEHTGLMAVTADGKLAIFADVCPSSSGSLVS
jgi:hypothetical protein